MRTPPPLIFSPRITHHGVASIANSLAGAVALSELSFAMNNIGPKGIAAFAKHYVLNRELNREKAPPHRSSLRALYLQSCQIGDQGAASVGDMLEDDESMKELFLFGNSIGDDGAYSIARGLTR